MNDMRTLLSVIASFILGISLLFFTFFYCIQSDKRLRKNTDDRKRMNSAFLDELLKYHDLDTINDAINGVSREDELVMGQDEKDVDKVLRKTFKNKMEFRMFMTYISQFMMDEKNTPVEAAAKSMKRLGKSDHEILQITNVIDKIF